LFDWARNFDVERGDFVIFLREGERLGCCVGVLFKIELFFNVFLALMNIING
jgi:hypothetical protein